MDLRPEGPLRVAQFTEEGVCAVVDLPPFGFAWVPKEADPGRLPAATGALQARGRQIRNESIEVEIDAATGGIRSVAAARRVNGAAGTAACDDGIVRRARQARHLEDARRAI